jgi:glycosyltransferase involved in cell wall biosynthesis
MDTYDLGPLESITSPRHLAGNYLYIAGGDLFNRLNQPAKHIPYHLKNHVDHLDLVGYLDFYDGSKKAPAWRRLTQGVHNILRDRLRIEKNDNLRTITIRRLRMPHWMEWLIEDLWIYWILCSSLANTYAVCIVYDPESALLGWILKRTGRIRKLIYHDIDYYPSVHPRWSRIVAWRESILLREADGVASVSRQLRELRLQQGARKVIHLPNGVDFTRFNEAYQKKTPHPPTMIYCGSLDNRWGVDLPLMALPGLKKSIPDIHLLFAGSGQAEQELKRLTFSLGLEDIVHFVGLMRYQDLPELLAQADIGIATSRPGMFRQFASPLKIFEYMAAGLPVICSGAGEAEQIIAESGAGVNISFSTDEFISTVSTLFQSPEKMDYYRCQGFKYAQDHSWEKLGERMAVFITEIQLERNR